MRDITISEQGRYAFWTDPSISAAKIFLTADYIWGPNECHHCEHRYIISVYLYARSPSGNGSYFLGDQYMTVRSYEGDDETVDILGLEKQEILARLKRVQGQLQ